MYATGAIGASVLLPLPKVIRCYARVEQRAASVRTPREWLEILGDFSRHDDPELHGKHEEEQQAPVMRRPPSDGLIAVLRHPRGILTRSPDRGSVNRYFVAHANVRNATRLTPIAIQAHTGMAHPP
jgi:hypothetical protein